MTKRELEKSAATGNRKRDEKWKQVMANQAINANANAMTAKAKMTDVNQQTSLQDLRNQGAMSVSRQRGQNQMATVVQIGRSRMAQIGATGAENRKTLGLGQKNAMELGERKNIYDKEADNRNFATKAMIGGAPVDAKLQNSYNTSGEFDADIQGVQTPQQQPDSGIGFMRVGGGVDKKGNKLPDRIMRTNDRSGEVSSTAQAPQSALEMLQQDPDRFLDSFVEKYGYMPDGYGQ